MAEHRQISMSGDLEQLVGQLRELAGSYPGKGEMSQVSGLASIFHGCLVGRELSVVARAGS